MSKREFFSRYNLILNKLRRSPSTFRQISDFLAVESEIQSYNYNISKRTFQRDMDDILVLFNIEIKYDPSQKVYYIGDEGDSEVNSRILEAFDTIHALNLYDSNSRYIHFDKRRPLGSANLYGFLNAIKQSRVVHFFYQKYYEDEKRLRVVEPYALKEFKNRWYVLAKDLNDGLIKTFALDRISDFGETGEIFVYPRNFNVEEIFRDSFGIMSPDGGEPETVVLSFDPFQGNYVKSLPLHESQEVLIDDADELRVKLKLHLTHDFIMELLSMGEMVTAIQPESLVEHLKSVYRRALDLY